MGPGADILEELTHGRHMQQEQHSEESAAAVSNMQQRQSAGSAVAEV
jgi:hypothetical protein